LAASYAKRLQKEIERGFRLVKDKLLPMLPKLPGFQRADIAGDADRINEIMNSILNRFFGGMLSKDQPNLGRYGRAVASKIVLPMQAQVDGFSQVRFTRQFKRISGVAPLQFAPELSDALEVAGDQNVNKITTVSSKYFDDIREMTNQALRKGTSVKELAEDIRILTDSTKTQSKLIAIDQVQKLNADLERTRQQANGIKRYIWRTRKNARVRSKSNSSGFSDHQGLEGAVFDYGFPPVTVLKGKRAGERNNPGMDINCKCWQEPVIEDLTGKVTPQLIAAEDKTRKLIEAGRVPGYKLPKRKEAA
jgi:uncharacterized protein with gpF-like domain